MIRISLAGFCFAVCTAVLIRVVLAQGSGTSLVSKQLTVTNIDPAYFSGQHEHGTFSLRGKPRLRATLPEKHLNLEATQLDGVADPTSGILKTAKLTGGVTGSMDSTSADGPERITFAGPVVNYTNQGAAADQDADIDISGGAVTFALANPDIPRKILMRGTHGVFKIRKIAGSVGLSEGDVTGPVALDFSGVSVDKAKHKSPILGHATGGQLSIRRGGAAATNYILRLSGGVQVRGTLTGPLPDAQLTTDTIDIELDSAGNFVQFWTEGNTSSTASPGKSPA